MATCATLPCSSSTSSSGVAFAINNPGGTAIKGQGSIGLEARGSIAVMAIGSSNGLYSYSEDHSSIYAYNPNYHAIYAYSANSNAYAGYFNSRVYVSGYLTKAGGGFKIDHPLDSANKYLNHSFVESPEMKNVYDGVVVLDDKGEAQVKLPEWFEALNCDVRYQLTAIGAPAPNLYIAEEISHHRFKIAGGEPGMKVSWQVTGIRHDRWTQANSIAVEEEKSDSQRGYYLHPELYNQAEEKGIEWAKNPEMMRQMKELQENPPSIDIPQF